VSDQTSDEILMAAYQGGNEQAFEALFRRHAASIYGFLVRRLGDASLAEDLYQEAFLRLHRARHTYDPGRPFRAWLFGIVHNLVNDSLRSRLRAPRTRPFEKELEPEGAHVGDARHETGLNASELSDPRSPESLVSGRELGLAVSRAVSALPGDEATVLILARLEGLSYEDIGSIVGRTPAATKQLAYRALKRVREELASCGFEEDS
jgi:RNA polymerase sigma-70 factor (ECF subfamily)